MKKINFLRSLLVVVLAFVANLTVFAGIPENNLIYNSEEVDGVKEILGLETVIGPAFPESMIPKDIKEILESEHYELMLITNEYLTASDEVNAQIDELNHILKSYDEKGWYLPGI